MAETSSTRNRLVSLSCGHEIHDVCKIPNSCECKCHKRHRSRLAEEIRVVDIIEEFEEKGLIKRTWDDKKQDYVWNKTELGHKMAKKLGIK